MSANWARFRQMCSDNVCRRCGKVTETIEVLLGFFVSKVLCDKCFEEKQKEALTERKRGGD